MMERECKMFTFVMMLFPPTTKETKEVVHTAATYFCRYIPRSTVEFATTDSTKSHICNILIFLCTLQLCCVVIDLISYYLVPTLHQFFFYIGIMCTKHGLFEHRYSDCQILKMVSVRQMDSIYSVDIWPKGLFTHWIGQSRTVL